MRLSKDEYFCDFSIRASERKLFDVLQTLEGPHRITIKKWRRKRTNPQNAYYRGVVVPMITAGLNELGWQYDEEKTHQELKGEFLLGQLTNEKTGEVKTYVRSTAELDTAEMTKYIEECRQYASQHVGIYIPDPNEYLSVNT